MYLIIIYPITLVQVVFNDETIRNADGTILEFNLNYNIPTRY